MNVLSQGFRTFTFERAIHEHSHGHQTKRACTTHIGTGMQMTQIRKIQRSHAVYNTSSTILISPVDDDDDNDDDG